MSLNSGYDENLAGNRRLTQSRFPVLPVILPSLPQPEISRVCGLGLALEVAAVIHERDPGPETWRTRTGDGIQVHWLDFPQGLTWNLVFLSSIYYIISIS